MAAPNGDDYPSRSSPPERSQTSLTTLPPVNRPQLYNAFALISALWAAPQFVPGASLPASAWGIAAIAFLFAPGRSRHPSPVWRELTQYLFSFVAVGLSLLAADFFILNLRRAAYAFIPLWIAIDFLALLRFLPWKAKVAPICEKAVGWLQALGRNRLMVFDDVAISGALIAGAVTWLARALAPALHLPGGAALCAGGLWLLIDRLPVRRWQDGTSRPARLGRLFARQAMWTLLVAACSSLLAGGFSRDFVAWLIVTNLFLGGFAFSHANGVVHGFENLRRVLLGAYALWLVHPFATIVTQGSGDGAWYANTVADVLAQTHAGTFPVFVGQSEFLFNGGIYPLRLAPLLQHYAMLADLLTLGTLQASAVLNLVLILTFLAGCAITYTMLASLIPDLRWGAAGLTMLYLGCPGVLALVYSSDLYMTWTTLPWLPVAYCGCARSFRDRGIRPFGEMVLGLAPLWWGHAPVALWSTLVVGLIQLFRLARQPLRLLDWRILAGAAGAFALLALYPLVSVLAVPLEPGTPNIVYQASPGSIVYFLNEAFPGMLLPLSRQLRSLADFQSGWAILLLIAATATTAWRLRLRLLEFWCVAGAALVLLFLLVPIPGVSLAIWTFIPGFIRNPTGTWPMQRFYVIIAVCAIFSTASFSKALSEIRGRRSHRIGWLLLAAIIWTTFEADVYVANARRIQASYAQVQSQRLPENNVLTRYSYLVFSKPPAYFSHGTVDPLLEQRLLARGSLQVLLSNTGSITSPSGIGRLLGSGILSSRRLGEGTDWHLEPEFRLEPQRRYVLDFDFLQPDAKGVLVIGGHTLSRVYELPRHGEELAFGSGAAASKSLPLFTSSSTAGTIQLRFILSETPASRDLSAFARYRWLEYSPEDLPIRVNGWIPYDARVNSPTPAWLETPRMFQQGYRARVDGREVVPAKSPQGLVMFPVPPGESHVTLIYRPPLLLGSTYFISLSAFVIVLGWLAVRWWQVTRPSG